MAQLPNNIVALLGVDVSNNVVNIDPNIFLEAKPSEQLIQQVLAPQQEQERPAPVVITNETSVALEIDADANYIPIVSPDRLNLVNSMLYQSNKRVGFNTKSPQHEIDVYLGSVNITTKTTTKGYKINGYNVASIDEATNKLFIGNDTEINVISLYSLLIKGLIPGSPLGESRIVTINDLGVVSATQDVFLRSINGLTAKNQTFAIGTAGTDFNIVSSTSTHTFNLPTASATNRGLLSSSDWTSFNNKFTLPSFTAGSIIFSNGSTLAQDNANLFYDDGNNRAIIASAYIGTIGNPAGVTANDSWTFSSNVNIPLVPVSNTHATSKKYVDDIILISTLNGLSTKVQTFATGTSGTDFNISSAGSTHTFNIPTASATNRGLLSSADWSTFNGKFTLPTFTAGAVIFSDGTTLVQDYANFAYDDANNRLTITSLYAPTIGNPTGVTANNTWTFSSNVNVPLAPTQDAHAASKKYVDDTALTGLRLGAEVKTVSLTNITLSANQTISGYATATGDRVLVTGQTNKTENGVYITATGAWTRATDSDTDAELRGYQYLVVAGAESGARFGNTNTTAITVGTTDITYQRISSAEVDPIFSASAASGITSTNISNWNTSYDRSITSITVSGSGTSSKTITFNRQSGAALTATFTDAIHSVAGTANRITVSTASNVTTVDIASNYAGQSSIVTVGTITTGVWQGSAIADAYIASAATWNAKQNAITGAASTITTSDLTASRALVSDAFGKVSVSSVTSGELGFVSGVTSSIQTQLNNRQPLNATLTALAALTLGTGFLRYSTSTSTWSFDSTSYYPTSNPSGYTSNTGTVTSVSVASANGFGGSVASATTTPAITITTSVNGIAKGNGTALSAAVPGVDYQAPISLTTTGSGAATFVGNVLNIPTPSPGVTSFNGRTGAVVPAEGDYSLTSLSDVTITSPSTDQVLVYNGAGWINATRNFVTSVSVVSANGFAGSVANASSTPAITIGTSVSGIIKGNGSAISAAVANTDYQVPITLTTTGSGAATFNGTTLNIPTPATGVTSFNGRTGAVVAAEGDYTLTQLSDVNIAGPTNGQVLTYSNGTWVNLTPTGGSAGLGGSGTTNKISKFTGSTTLGDSNITDSGSAISFYGVPSSAYRVNIQTPGGRFVSFWTPTIDNIDANGIMSHNGNGLFDQTPLGLYGSVIVFGTGITEAARMTGGNWLVGTATNITGGGKLQVSGNVNITGQFMVNGVPISGGGGVAGVSSFNGRTGVVVSQVGDYNITQLSGVAISSPSVGQVLTFNGTNWVNAAPTGGGVGGGVTFLSQLQDVSISSLQNGQALIYDSALGRWRNQTISAGGGSGNVSTGGGTTNQIVKFTGSTSIGNSIMAEVDGNRINVSGTVYATAFYEFSDVRKKNIVEKLQSFDASRIEAIQYYFKDDKDQNLRIGYSAQQIQELAPDLVHKNEEGFLTISYANVHTIKIAQLEDRVKVLEKEIIDLRNRQSTTQL